MAPGAVVFGVKGPEEGLVAEEAQDGGTESVSELSVTGETGHSGHVGSGGGGDSVWTHRLFPASLLRPLGFLRCSREISPSEVTFTSSQEQQIHNNGKYII
ncbi:unnamed protein product [Pleuronectes platessa]|uniref:Uncharacterized protein n=1 Tax=Pleuronectes platessa TaxID=8262 RepID=A0A9N7TIC5_PLEPL|nr:unnamed protein product [Pleuronectes platessa]